MFPLPTKFCMAMSAMIAGACIAPITPTLMMILSGICAFFIGSGILASQWLRNQFITALSFHFTLGLTITLFFTKLIDVTNFIIIALIYVIFLAVTLLYPHHNINTSGKDLEYDEDGDSVRKNDTYITYALFGTLLISFFVLPILVFPLIFALFAIVHNHKYLDCIHNVAQEENDNAKIAIYWLHVPYTIANGWRIRD